MSKLISVAGVVVLSFIATSALADPTAGASKGTHPCKQLREWAIQACQSAGYVKGEAKKGNGLHKNCVHPIMQGQTPAKISGIDTALVQQCQERKAKRKAKRSAAH
jgi:hypothetical protein